MANELTFDIRTIDSNGSKLYCFTLTEGEFVVSGEAHSERQLARRIRSSKRYVKRLRKALY